MMLGALLWKMAERCFDWLVESEGVAYLFSWFNRFYRCLHRPYYSVRDWFRGRNIVVPQDELDVAENGFLLRDGSRTVTLFGQPENVDRRGAPGIPGSRSELNLVPPPKPKRSSMLAETGIFYLSFQNNHF